jgi:hypothetical protein
MATAAGPFWWAEALRKRSRRPRARGIRSSGRRVSPSSHAPPALGSRARPRGAPVRTLPPFRLLAGGSRGCALKKRGAVAELRRDLVTQHSLILGEMPSIHRFCAPRWGEVRNGLWKIGCRGGPARTSGRLCRGAQGGIMGRVTCGEGKGRKDPCGVLL